MTLSTERVWRRVRQLVVVPNPAAGVDWSVSVPSGQVWYVRSIYAELVTSAVVANRNVALDYLMGDLRFASISAPGNATASATWKSGWWFNGSSSLTSGYQVRGIPASPLGAGCKLQAVTANIDVADQWQNISVYADVTTVRGTDANNGEMPDMIVDVLGVPAMVRG